MAAKGSRYVRPVAGSPAPAVLVSAAPEYAVRRVARGGATIYHSADHVWYRVGRRTGSVFRAAGPARRVPVADWWRVLDGLARPRQPALVVAPSGADFLTSAGFWPLADSGRYQIFKREFADTHTDGGAGGKSPRPWVGRLVFGGPPDIISFLCGRGTVRVCSVTNWLEHGPAALARRVGLDCPEPAGGRGDSWGECPAGIACDAIYLTMAELISSWVREDNGPWRDTAGACAVSLWRRRAMTEKVCRHSDTAATELEEQSLYGGRQILGFVGDIGCRLSLGADADPPPPPSPYPTIEDELVRYDIRSMYPSIMLDSLLPVRLMSVHGETDPDELRAACDYWQAIASVSVRTDRPDYPVRVGTHTVYPVGEYDTVLPHAELVHAIARGRVARVHRWARYQAGRPWRAFAELVLAGRERARAAGDEVLEQWYKRLANSFGGKFAQRSDRWEPQPHIQTEVRWGRWMRKSAIDGSLSHLRSVAGLAFLRVPGVRGGALPTACYSALTSLGRMALAGICDTLPPNSVAAADTDGLWVLASCAEAALSKSSRLGSTPGKLRVVGRTTFARFYGPQHYYTGGRWTLAGYPNGWQIDAEGRVVVTEAINPIRSYPGRAPAMVATRTTARPLPSLASSYTVGPDGWTRPPVFSPRFVPTADRTGK